MFNKCLYISDKDTAKLYVQFLDQNNLKSKNELIYIKDFKVVQTIRVFKLDKTLPLAF